MVNKKLFSFIQNPHLWSIIHKLTQDALALSLFSFAALMTLESLMPGFVSSHLNLAKTGFGIVALFFMLLAIESIKGIVPSTSKIPQWLVIALLAWSSVLVINSLIKFPLYAIIITFLLTTSIVKLFYQEFFEQN